MFNIIIGIVTILTFIILCIDILPKWYQILFGKWKIFIQHNTNVFDIYITFHKKFAISRIFLTKKSHYGYNGSDLHPHTTPFQYKTFNQIANNHHITIKSNDLQSITIHNKEVVANNKIEWTITLITADGKETQQSFTIPTSNI